MMSYNGIDLPIVTPEFAAWVEANIPPGHVFEFDTYYDSNATACLPVPPAFDPPPIRTGVLHWPTGASRWATFHTVMTGEQLATLRTSLGATNAYPEAALVIDDGVVKTPLTAMMAMLPPRPLSGYSPYSSPYASDPYNSTDEAYGENNDFWLVTLVDDRYFWWFLQLTSKIDSTSWTTVFTAILGGLGLSTGGAGVLGLNYPKPGDRWKVQGLPLPLLLDAAATAVGCRVTRDMQSGNVSIQSWQSARSQSQTLYARQFGPDGDLDNADFKRVAGGAYFGVDLRRSVPASVVISPNDDGSSPSTVTLASLAAVSPYFKGLTGRPGESALIRTDDGETLTSTMKDQIAGDWYGWQLADVDLTLGGLAIWDACAWQEAVSWEHRGGKIVTRITRPPFPLGAARGLCKGGGGGSDWEPYQITDNTSLDDAGTPVYSWKKVKLAPDPVTGYPTWQDVSPAVTGTDNAYRMPSKSYIPPLIDIGQVVLGRASPTDPGKYELTPWGGQRRNIKKDLVDVVVSCGPDTNGSPTMIVTKTYRYLRFHGRDFCLTLGSTTDSEEIG